MEQAMKQGVVQSMKQVVQMARLSLQSVAQPASPDDLKMTWKLVVVVAVMEHVVQMSCFPVRSAALSALPDEPDMVVEVMVVAQTFLVSVLVTHTDTLAQIANDSGQNMMTQGDSCVGLFLLCVLRR
jgi:hypothetical protein